ncbi:MAG TPA: SBBP repeat-containing protein, partial [Flavobacteriales bacterium]|nr:SBBP repeat-containing protein [Flavobacteriales bacterium]
MKGNTLTAMIALLHAIGLNAQSFEWTKSFGGSLADYGLSIALDASGNVYTTGYFQGTVDFDPGAGTANRTSSGGRDIWVQKLDASGNFIWARSFGGSSDDTGRSITVDASGNVYTTGYFQGTADFDPGAGTATITSAGNEDIFIQKLDASGNFLWAKSFGGSLADHGLSIAVDAAGNVYTTGYFQGTADFDPGAGTANHSSAGDEDIFVQKLDTSGNFVWARSFGDSNSDRGNSICVDASGNVYTTGGFDGTVDFDPGAGTTNLTSEGSLDVYVQKLNATGNFVWARSFGGSLNDQGFSITVDDSGNVHTTGSFEGTVDFDPGAGSTTRTSTGSLDVFVQKLSASGTYDWAISFGASSSDQGYSVTVDASGNVYTTGSFLGTADFDPGSGTANLTSAGPWDIFIQKLNASGNFVWANSFGDSSIDGGYSITTDASGNIFTTGHFAGTVDFNPGVGTANLT